MSFNTDIELLPVCGCASRSLDLVTYMFTNPTNNQANNPARASKSYAKAKQILSKGFAKAKQASKQAKDKQKLSKSSAKAKQRPSRSYAKAKQKGPKITGTLAKKQQKSFRIDQKWSQNGAQEDPKRPLSIEPHFLSFLASLGSVLGSILAPYWDPSGLTFHTFWTCFLRSFFEGLWDPILIDFGTILTSILELFL